MKKLNQIQLLESILQELKEIKELSKPKSVQSALDEKGLIKLEMKDYMTPSYLIDECKKLFDVYIYSDFSTVTSERKGNYTVYFKDVQEADEENKNLSADDLKAKGIKGITLEERLLLEIEYFKKYGKHLDIENITLCSGSRYHNGYVPHVYFHSDNRTVYVSWFYPDNSFDSLRSRSAVS